MAKMAETGNRSGPKPAVYRYWWQLFSRIATKAARLEMDTYGSLADPVYCGVTFSVYLAGV